MSITSSSESYGITCKSSRTWTWTNFVRMCPKSWPPGCWPWSSPAPRWGNTRGKKGGTLRRGWTARTEQEAAGGGKVDPAAYANALPVFKRGRTFYIEVINPVHYASYVEFGHRTRGGGGWVAGQYFLTLSEKDLERVAPAVIEKKLEALLREAFNV